jgi:hypothetical protein
MKEKTNLFDDCAFRNWRGASDRIVVRLIQEGQHLPDLAHVTFT